jgi:hypothetical protein
MAKSLGDQIREVCQHQDLVADIIRSRIIYVAGPYSAKTIFGKLRNIYRAWRAARRLWEQGYTVVCPHMNSALMDGAISNDEFILRDLSILGKCDAIYMLKGWSRSKGARLERDYALQLGLEALYE